MGFSFYLVELLELQVEKAIRPKAESWPPSFANQAAKEKEFRKREGELDVRLKTVIY